MATKTVAIKKIRFTNPFPAIAKSFERAAEKLPELEAVFIRTRARSIMKKAPKKPKTPYGRLTPWGKRSKKAGKYYWKKGLYSRPGHPPHYHPESGDFNLRKISFSRIQSPQIPHKSASGGKLNAWRVGPMFRKNKWQPQPVPALHEYGGTIRFRKKMGATFKTRNGWKLRRNPRQTPSGDMVLTYPPRPYMRPAAKEARESAMRKMGPSLKELTKLGGWKGKRIY